MKRPNKEDYRPMVVGVDDYIEDLEKYCTYLENRNKQLPIYSVSVLFLYEFVNEFTDTEIPKKAIKETLDKLNER